MCEATAVRAGEELDLAALARYLDSALPGPSGAPTVRQFPAGFSNLTYLVRRGDREVVLRRPPFGTKPKSGHDMVREFTVLSALCERFPYCPRPLALCEDPAVLGAPFFLMERLDGLVLRRDPPPGLDLSPARARALCERMVDVLAELHALDPAEAGLAELGRPAGYVARQVAGWSERYRRARTDDAPSFERVIAYLQDRQPPDAGRAAILHNDFKLDNLVLDPDDPARIRGVLDWEMSTVGDPWLELGSSLAYWVEADDPEELQASRMMPTQLDGMLTRREIAARYTARSGGIGVEIDFYYTFGLFRLAVIAQQIYLRYRRGQTRDPRFATLRSAVAGLERAAQRAIDRS